MQIAQATQYPEGTQVTIQGTVGSASWKTGVSKQTGKQWTRLDFAVQDASGIAQCKSFRAPEGVVTGAQVTVTGSIKMWNNKVEISADDISIIGGVPIPEPAPSFTPAAPPPSPPPGFEPPHPAVVNAAPPPPAPGPVPEVQGPMSMNECIQVWQHVRSSMSREMGLNEAGLTPAELADYERVFQAMAVSIIIGMNQGNIERLSIPF